MHKLTLGHSITQTGSDQWVTSSQKSTDQVPHLCPVRALASIPADAAFVTLVPSSNAVVRGAQDSVSSERSPARGGYMMYAWPLTWEQVQREEHEEERERNHLERGTLPPCCGRAAVPGLSGPQRRRGAWMVSAFQWFRDTSAQRSMAPCSAEPVQHGKG